MDKLKPEARSRNMQQIRSVDTKPELVVRSLLHQMGFRFRLHSRQAPGKPDIVFPSRRKVIFVHGCFWHQHPGCREGRVPHSRQEYWGPKLARNVQRDAENETALKPMGWKTLVIWECELKNMTKLRKTLAKFLNGSVDSTNIEAL